MKKKKFIPISRRIYFIIISLVILGVAAFTVIFGFDLTRSMKSSLGGISAVILFSLILVALALVFSIILTGFIRKTIVLPLKRIGEICSEAGTGNFSERISIDETDEIGILAKMVDEMMNNLHEKYELNKFVPNRTLASLYAGERGKRVPVTLLFSNINSFTSYTQKNPPERVISSLNKILNFQTEVIMENGGDIDKYVGDQLTVTYAEENSELSACRTAIQIQKMISERTDLDKLSVGIGVHKGDVILGSIGYEKNSELTILGDAVQAACRLCDVAGPGQVIISQEVFENVKSMVKVDGPFRLRVKGKDIEMIVYFLKDVLEAESESEDVEDLMPVIDLSPNEEFMAEAEELEEIDEVEEIEDVAEEMEEIPESFDEPVDLEETEESDTPLDFEGIQEAEELYLEEDDDSGEITEPEDIDDEDPEELEELEELEEIEELEEL